MNFMNEIVNMISMMFAGVFMIVIIVTAIPMLLLRMIGQGLMLVVNAIMKHVESRVQEQESEKSDVDKVEES